MNCEFPEGRSREYCVAEERKEGSYMNAEDLSNSEHHSQPLLWPGF